MSSNRRPLLAATLCAATVALACRPGSDAAINRVANRDSVARAAAAESLLAYIPTPGFSSAQGTPAPAGIAVRQAPPPHAALTADVGADEQAAIHRIPPGDGHDLVVANCLTCHSAAMVEQQHKDTAGWNKTVTLMMKWGAPLPAAQKPTLIAYLSRHFGARPSPPPTGGITSR